MRGILKTLLVGAAIAAIGGAANAANLIVNGGFNNGATVTAPGGGFATLGIGSNALTGWAISGGNIDWITGYWQSADGDGFSVDLNGSTPGAISQTIGTVVGQAYTLTFAMSGNPDAFRGETRVAVIGAGGSSIGTASYDLTGANSKSNMLWATRAFSFTANSASTVISFTSGNGGSNCCYGAALDNVSVVSAPEPAAWALMIAGFGSAGVMIRRRRATA